jgi:hypothetical protein
VGPRLHVGGGVGRLMAFVLFAALVVVAVVVLATLLYVLVRRWL